jgi:2-polyprenyl-3-methyl-5-hydroxy-6-metoxy-1,4-benzoquinol methylase
MTSSHRTSRFFDSYAHDFDAIYGTRNNPLNSLINRFLRKSMMLRYRRTIEGCDPIDGRTVIDIGCGPGHYAIALAKKGARHVLGIDFADRMIELANEYAQRAGVSDRCEFVCGDFMTYPADHTFDYSILMGFMDYVADPREVIERAVAVTGSRAFFSFPADGGFLSWQRKLRYRRRCDLYLYKPDRLKDLFARLPGVSMSIEKIARDYFVTASLESDRRLQ